MGDDAFISFHPGEEAVQLRGKLTKSVKNVACLKVSHVSSASKSIPNPGQLHLKYRQRAASFQSTPLHSTESFPLEFGNEAKYDQENVEYVVSFILVVRFVFVFKKSHH